MMEKYNITPNQKEQIRSLSDVELEKFYNQVNDIMSASKSQNHERIKQLEKAFSFGPLIDREDSYTDVDYFNSFRTEAFKELQRRREDS